MVLEACNWEKNETTDIARLVHSLARTGPCLADSTSMMRYSSKSKKLNALNQMGLSLTMVSLKFKCTINKKNNTCEC